ncbi:MAG: N-6-adenine-methyltransferase [Bryobacterales bacterium]|nr:N-6-adenine-methyltransferase [Bryobacterales bacterium]
MIGAVTAGLSSSLRQDWATPRALFHFLNKEFRFILDVCATKETATCICYFDEAADALTRVWPGPAWCNPPYGRKIGRWIQKAADEARLGSTVVMLIPARTDTSWWHDIIIPHATEIRFLRGRLCFDDNRKGRCPFPSAIVVFRGESA